MTHSGFAETLVGRSQKIRNENGLDIFAVPLTTLEELSETTKHFVFGEPLIKRNGHKHRTILLIGSSGSGKTSFINAMINCIFNVQWWDPFIQLPVDSRTSRQSEHKRL